MSLLLGNNQNIFRNRTLLHIEHDGIIQLANVLSHCLDMAKNNSEEDEKTSIEHLEKSR